MDRATGRHRHHNPGRNQHLAIGRWPALVIALVVASAFTLASCKGTSSSKILLEAEPGGKDDPASGRVIVSIVGTSDLHGHLEALPVLGGYVANLRQVRTAGGVVLVDAGDMFQGTLESNSDEGAIIVRAYNSLGYAAAAVGNHEFDFGPLGPKAIPTAATDDPHGALRARAAEAVFPFLAANISSSKSGGLLPYKNVRASSIIEISDLDVGLIGVTTVKTPQMTIADNIKGLSFTDLAAAIEREATALRARGAAIIVVAAHAGGTCNEFHSPHDIASCDDNEIFAVAGRLPSGLVDVIVAGHTHQAIAHRVNGIAIIESYANGQAFGRVDLVVRDGVLKESVIFPPRRLCSTRKTLGTDRCRPGSYEGSPVIADPTLKALVDEAREGAREARERRLGVTLGDRIKRSYREESALGNLFADLMLAARPEASVAITNGGGLRADLPRGPLTYGALFEAMPFDNQFAFVTLTGRKLRELIEDNMTRSSGILLAAGLKAKVSCQGGRPVARLSRPDGTPIRASEKLTVVTSDFLASGGDGAFSRLGLPEGSIRFERGKSIRDEMIAALASVKAPLRSTSYYDRASPRLTLPGKRPLCDAR